MKDCRNPEFDARSAPLAAGDIDWMLLETTFWLHGFGGGVETGATLIVSCAPVAPVGGHLASMTDERLAVTCTYGRGNALGARPWRDRIVEFGVVHVRKGAGLPVQAIDDLLARMKAEGVRHLAVVCADAGVRRALRHADSFVAGSERTDITTSGIVADLLHHVVLAPATRNCLDIHDLDPPLGTADAPAVVAEAVHRWGSTELAFVGDADARAFARARLVGLMIQPGAAPMRQVTGLVRALQSRIGDRDVTLAWGAPLALFNPAWQSTRVTLVRLLCVP